MFSFTLLYHPITTYPKIMTELPAGLVDEGESPEYVPLSSREPKD
jgi:hypothetical protein